MQKIGLLTGEALDAVRRVTREGERVLADTEQTTEELRSVATTYSLGRAPQAGDPAGMYRWVDAQGSVLDTAWDGGKKTGETLALPTTQQLAAARRDVGLVPASAVGLYAGANIRDALTYILNNDQRAVGLQDQTYTLAGSQLVVNKRPLRGVRAGDTIIQATMNPGQPAIALNVGAEPNGFFQAGGELLSNVEVRGAEHNGVSYIPAADDTAHAYGVLHGGSHTSTDNVKVTGFISGYVVAGSNNYLNRVNNLHAYSCGNGLELMLGGTNQGENMLFSYGCLHDNLTNVSIRASAWFLTLQNMSLDYPRHQQFWVGQKLYAARMDGGHLEWLRYKFVDDLDHSRGEYAVWLANGPAGIDAGVMVFSDVNIVMFEREGRDPADPNSNMQRKRFAERGADELLAPNIAAATLVFRNCVDAVFGERIHRVIVRGRVLPDVNNINGTWWTNDTGVAVRVKLRVTFDSPTDSVRGYDVLVSDKAGGGERVAGGASLPAGAATSDTSETTFTVQAGERCKVLLGGATITRADCELLP